MDANLGNVDSVDHNPSTRWINLLLFHKLERKGGLNKHISRPNLSMLIASVDFPLPGFAAVSHKRSR